jgi:hypothetical protein
MEKPPKVALTDDELVERYISLVGVNPKFRAMSREQMEAGIEDPNREQARLRELDSEEDKEEIQKTYRR